MNAKQEHVLRTFHSVAAFLQTKAPHPLPRNFPLQLRALQDVIARLSQYAIDQDAGVRFAGRETERQIALRTELRERWMKPIANIARAVLRDAPGIEKALRAPHSKTRNRALIAAANAMAEAAAPYRAIYADIGLSDDVAAELRGAAERLTESLTDRLQHRGRRRAATGTIAVDIANGRRAVQILGAMIRHAYHGDVHTLAEWDGARKVRRTGGMHGGAPAGFRIA
ncbi:MAG: hypothetical protein NVS4B3_28540 [Gemmatimonadaceae bacterium]